jgi:hypothetical protein
MESLARFASGTGHDKVPLERLNYQYGHFNETWQFFRLALKGGAGLHVPARMALTP